MIHEFRRNKESDYYDLRKRNYSRSMELVKGEHFATPHATTQTSNETEKCLFFKRESVGITMEMMKHIGKTYLLKDTSVLQIVSFIAVVMQLDPCEDLRRQLSCTVDASLSYISDLTRRWIITRKLAWAFSLFHEIWQTINAVLDTQPMTQQMDGKVEGGHGISLAVALGHVSETNLRPDFVIDVVTEGIPPAFTSGRHNPGLDALFEGLERMPLPLPTHEALRRGLQQFVKLCQALVDDDSTSLLIDAFKVPSNDKYYALVLEGLSKLNQR
jgi:hypothetical protein